MPRSSGWRAFALAAVAMAAGSLIVSGQITVPNTFVNGTVADAPQVNANFNALAANALNRTGGTMTGTLTARDLTPSTDATYKVGTSTGPFRFLSGDFSGTVTATTFAGALAASNLTGTVPAAKGGTGLDGSAAANGTLAIGNGAGYALATLTAAAGITITNGAGTITIAGTGVVDRQVALQTVSNTVTETAVYTYAAPGGTLSTNRTLHLSLIGDFLQNSGASDKTYTVRVKYGATTIASYIVNNVTTSALRGALIVDVELTAANATGAQRSKGWFSLQDAATAGSGNTTNDGTNNTVVMTSVHNSVAEDSTASKNLVVTYQMGTAAATMDMRAHTVYTEVK